MSGIINSAGSKSGVIGTTELDYEEGTYIPTIVGSGSPAGSMTCSTDKSLGYTKIGNRVHVSGKLTPTTNNSIRSTILFSLPFTAGTAGDGNSASSTGHAILRSGGVSGIQQNQSVQISPGGTNFYIMYLNDNGDSDNIGGITATLPVDSSWNLWLAFSYQTV